MNSGSHIMAGCIAGLLLFFSKEIQFIDVLLFVLLSSFMDLDHIVNKFRHKSEYHLRSFIQEPFAILIIGIPLGLVFYIIFNSLLYFWLCPLLYTVHIFLDYICIFETCPLAPFSYRIMKPEGYGLILPFAPEWNKRKAEFRGTLSELFVMIALAIILIVIIILH